MLTFLLIGMMIFALILYMYGKILVPDTHRTTWVLTYEYEYIYKYQCFGTHEYK